MRLAAATLGLVATQAAAGGLDITGQPVTFIFAEGRVAELGFGISQPEITGRDAGFLGGSDTGDLGQPVHLFSFSYKQDLSDRLSFGLLLEKPFGAGIAYPAGASLAFGGTQASAETTSVTVLARYRLSDRVSVFGGPRFERAAADFRLSGAIYGPLTGYTADMDTDSGVGYVIGAAFEIPEYFLRVSLAYGSEIEHSFRTTETSFLGATVSDVSATMPQSLNLEFQTGIAPGTFVFGGARWVEWSKLQFGPPVLSSFSPDPLVDFKDTWTYALGVGRQFSDSWTGTLTFIHEPSTDKTPLPLTPTDGFRGIALGAIHRGEMAEVHLNAAVTELGDTTPYVDALGTTVSRFEGNRSMTLGTKIVFRF